MTLSEICSLFTKRGYQKDELNDHRIVFYEFSKQDFLYNDCVKKFELDYSNELVDKLVMVQYWFSKTTIREISTIDELTKLI